MFFEIFKFDLRYQVRSPLFWVTYVLFGLSGFFLEQTFSLDGALERAYINAPMMIVQAMSVYSLISMFAMTLFVAMPLLRDHELQIAELFFVKPVSKRDYVLGRYCAGLTLCLLMFGVMLGLAALGFHMPWNVDKRVGPESLFTYLYAFGVVVLPNLIFISGIVAFLASVTRKILHVFLGVMLVFVLWGVAQSQLRGDEVSLIALLFDPSGNVALTDVTRYWLVSDYDSRLPEITGTFLANRLVLTGLGMVFLFLGVHLFRPIRTGTAKGWFKRKAPSTATVTAVKALPVRRVQPRDGMGVWMAQFVHLVWFEAKSILGSVTFMVLSLVSSLLALANMSGNIRFFGQLYYPTTSWVIEILSRSMTLFVSIILIFYAGELMYKERAAKIHEVVDACPIRKLQHLLAKAVSLVTASVVFLCFMILAGMFFQLLLGYTEFELGLYVQGMGLALLPYLPIGIFALAMQALVQNKFVGYILAFLPILIRLSAGALGIEDNLLIFGGAPSLPLSGMNGFGNNLVGLLSFRVYWLLFSVCVLLLVSGAWVRSGNPSPRQRFNLAVQVLRGPQGKLLAVAVVAFLGCGAWIFTNTHVWNSYRSRKTLLDEREEYERVYGAKRNAPQPKITGLNVKLDLYPSQRDFAGVVTYTVTNPTDQPIRELDLMVDKRLTLTPPSFASIRTYEPMYGLYRLTLNEPLLPGASAEWALGLDQNVKGFTNRGNTSMILANGTYLHGYSMLPSFGYNAKNEISDPEERKRRGLPKVEGLPEPDAPGANHVPYTDSPTTDFSDDADWIRFETIVSTDADQRALAPGDLVREWSENGRRFFHYRMNHPIGYYVSWLSARWDQAELKDPNLTYQVFHDPKHGANAQRMLEASKASISYCNEAFGAYPDKVFRIIEMPSSYGQFAESFNTHVPYGESFGFLADLRNPELFDSVYYVTAHEVSHQWWGNMMTPANAKGGAMLAESLAQYTALMVMKKTYGADQIRSFLKRELDTYLEGRGQDRLGELPLARVDVQRHVYYSKGSLVFYRLQEELGESVVNQAIRELLTTYAFKGNPYPTAPELVARLRAVAKPEHQQLITDLFEKITFYDNRVEDATVTRLPDGRYEVTFSTHSAKTYADAQGKETIAPLGDWMDIAVFAKKTGSTDAKALVLERTFVSKNQTTFSFIVAEEPAEVGIDPYNKLIDLSSDDNRKPVLLMGAPN